MIPTPVTAGDVTLRAWEPEEADLYASLRDDVVFRFTTESESVGERECRQGIVEARGSRGQVPFAVCDPGGRPVGNMALLRRGDTVEISYWLGEQARGRGWAAAALRAATEWAFRHWPVSQAELEIDLANEPSMRVAEAAGYDRRGTRLTSACGGPAAVFRRASLR
ncbi:MAG: GNAT family N-acetyltransferase [Actinomycetota bacterium]